MGNKLYYLLNRGGTLHRSQTSGPMSESLCLGCQATSRTTSWLYTAHIPLYNERLKVIVERQLNLLSI